jgi:hypothetical protein
MSYLKKSIEIRSFNNEQRYTPYTHKRNLSSLEENLINKKRDESIYLFSESSRIRVSIKKVLDAFYNKLLLLKDNDKKYFREIYLDILNDLKKYEQEFNYPNIMDFCPYNYKIKIKNKKNTEYWSGEFIGIDDTFVSFINIINCRICQIISFLNDKIDKSLRHNIESLVCISNSLKSLTVKLKHFNFKSLSYKKQENTSSDTLYRDIELDDTINSKQFLDSIFKQYEQEKKYHFSNFKNDNPTTNSLRTQHDSNIMGKMNNDYVNNPYINNPYIINHNVQNLLHSSQHEKSIHYQHNELVNKQTIVKETLLQHLQSRGINLKFITQIHNNVEHQYFSVVGNDNTIHYVHSSFLY